MPSFFMPKCRCGTVVDPFEYLPNEIVKINRIKNIIINFFVITSLRQNTGNFLHY